MVNVIAHKGSQTAVVSRAMNVDQHTLRSESVPLERSASKNTSELRAPLSATADSLATSPFVAAPSAGREAPFSSGLSVRSSWAVLQPFAVALLAGMRWVTKLRLVICQGHTKFGLYRCRD